MKAPWKALEPRRGGAVDFAGIDGHVKEGDWQAQGSERHGGSEERESAARGGLLGCSWGMGQLAILRKLTTTFSTVSLPRAPRADALEVRSRGGAYRELRLARARRSLVL